MILDIICVILSFSFLALFIMIKITDFLPGDRVRLISFGETDLFYRNKLLSLGVTRSVELFVMRVAPLGCPIQVEVRGTSLTLRKEEASHLQWERL